MPAIDPLAGRLITKLTMKALEKPDKKLSQKEYEAATQEALKESKTFSSKPMPIPSWVKFKEIQAQVDDGEELSMKDLINTLLSQMEGADRSRFGIDYKEVIPTDEEGKNTFYLNKILHIAVVLNLPDLVAKSIEQGAEINSKTYPLLGLVGDASVHLSSDFGEAEINSKTYTLFGLGGDTSVQLATEFGHLEILKLLLSKDPKSRESISLLNELFDISVEYGHLSIVEFLAANGAQIDKPSGQISTIEFLDAIGVKVDEPNNAYRGSYGKLSRSERPIAGGDTPLFIAAKHGNVEIVKFLIKNGANVNHKNIIGETAMHALVRKDLSGKIPLPISRFKRSRSIKKIGSEESKLEIFKILYEKGTRIDAINQNSDTPLLAAAHSGYSKLVGQLLKMGANVQHQNLLGNTALHEAVLGESFQLETVRTLVESGANLREKNKKGEIAFELCAHGEINPIQRKPSTSAYLVLQETNIGRKDPTVFPYLFGKMLSKNFSADWQKRINEDDLIIHQPTEFIDQLNFLKDTLNCSEADIAKFINGKLTPTELLKNKEKYFTDFKIIAQAMDVLFELQKTNQTLGKKTHSELGTFVSYFSNRTATLGNKSNLESLEYKMILYKKLRNYIPEQEDSFNKWLKIDVGQVQSWLGIDFKQRWDYLPYLLDAIKIFKNTKSDIEKLKNTIKGLNFKELLSDGSLNTKTGLALLGLIFEFGLEKEKLNEFLEYFKVNLLDLASVEKIRTKLVEYNPALGNQIIEKLASHYLEERISEKNLDHKIQFCNAWANPEKQIQNSYLDDVKDVYCNQAAFMKNKIKQYLEQTPAAAVAIQKQYPDFFNANDWVLFDQLSRQVKTDKVPDSAITKKEKPVIKPEKNIETIKEVAETKSKNTILGPDKLKLLLSQSITSKPEENIVDSIEKKVKEAHEIKDNAGLQERINYAFIASGISNRVQGDALLLFLARQVAEYLDDKPSDKYEELKFNWGNESLSLKTILETKMGLGWEENKSGVMQKGKKVVTRLLQGNTQVLTRAYDTLTASKLENFKKDYQKVSSIAYQGADKTQKEIAISPKVDGYSITQESGERVGFVIAANAQNAKMDYLTQLGKNRGDLSATFKQRYGNKLVFDGVGAMMSGSTPVVSIIEKGKPLNKTSTLEGRMQGLILMNAQGQPILLDKTNLSIAELNSIGMVKPYAAQLKKDFEILEKQLLKAADAIQTGEKSEVEALQKKHAGLIKEYWCWRKN